MFKYFGTAVLFLVSAATTGTVNGSSMLDDIKGDGFKYGITGLTYSLGSSVDEVKLGFEAEYPDDIGYYSDAGGVRGRVLSSGTTSKTNLRGGGAKAAGNNKKEPKEGGERKMVQWVPKDAIKTVPFDELTREGEEGKEQRNLPEGGGEQRKMVQWVPKDAILTVPFDELTKGAGGDDERDLQDNAEGGGEEGTDGGYSYEGSYGYVVAAYGVDDAAIGASLDIEIKYESRDPYYEP